jgi:hypothetical protein
MNRLLIYYKSSATLAEASLIILNAPERGMQAARSYPELARLARL